MSWDSGDPHRAALLWGAADTVWARYETATIVKQFGTAWTSQFTIPPKYAENEELVAVFEDGRKLTDVESFAVAMDAVPTHATRTGTGPLTPRQLDVLRLIAAGDTNKKIAEKLFISKRTADSHVSSILSTLGVSSRREAVAQGRKRSLLAD